MAMMLVVQQFCLSSMVKQQRHLSMRPTRRLRQLKTSWFFLQRNMAETTKKQWGIIDSGVSQSVVDVWCVVAVVVVINKWIDWYSDVDSDQRNQIDGSEDDSKQIWKFNKWITDVFTGRRQTDRFIFKHLKAINDRPMTKMTTGSRLISILPSYGIYCLVVGQRTSSSTMNTEFA